MSQINRGKLSQLSQVHDACHTNIQQVTHSLLIQHTYPLKDAQYIRKLIRAHYTKKRSRT